MKYHRLVQHLKSKTSCITFHLFFEDRTTSGCASLPDNTWDRESSCEIAESNVPALQNISYEEAEDLCCQLRMLKKQAMTALDQAKKSSERELLASQATKDSAEAEQTATT